MLQFESVKAADSHIAALDEHKRIGLLDDKLQGDIAMGNADLMEKYQNVFGLNVSLIPDSHTAANGALAANAAANNDKVGPAVVAQMPAPAGKHGDIAIISTAPSNFATNPNYGRDLVNEVARLTGAVPPNDQVWNSGGGKGIQGRAKWSPTPTPA